VSKAQVSTKPKRNRWIPRSSVGQRAQAKKKSGLAHFSHDQRQSIAALRKNVATAIIIGQRRPTTWRW
jgi:hypothetical protein